MTRPAQAPLSRPQEVVTPSSNAYSPWPTLAPTSWAPVVESDSNGVRVGAGVFGYDALQYHSYAATVTWLAALPAGAATNGATTIDWQLSYAYNRWRPVPFASVSMQTSFFAGPPTDRGVPTSAVLREQQVEGGVLVPFVHTRSSHAVLASMRANRRRLHAGDPRSFVEPDRGARRLDIHHRPHVRLFDQPRSRRHGRRHGGTDSERIRRLRRRDHHHGRRARVCTWPRAGITSWRSALPVALRPATSTCAKPSCSAGRGRTLSTTDFGRSATSLLRGFGANTFAGTHVAVLNADYRLPIARPQRGIGTWPLFLHTIHAAVFADAGHAWTQTFRASDDQDVGRRRSFRPTSSPATSFRSPQPAAPRGDTTAAARSRTARPSTFASATRSSVVDIADSTLMVIVRPI